MLVCPDTFSVNMKHFVPNKIFTKKKDGWDNKNNY